MKIGAWRRALTTRSSSPLPRIGSVLAVQVTMMSNSGSRSRHFVQRDRLGVEALGKPLAALERAIGDRDRLRLARGEVRRGELDHLAGADQQQALVAERRERCARRA